MNIIIENKITEARKFFEDDSYLLDFYNSAIECYEKSDSPLKINNFACNIRELLREKMALVDLEKIKNNNGKCYLYIDNKNITNVDAQGWLRLENLPMSFEHSSIPIQVDKK